MNILKRKFLLLTVLASLAFSACNTYSVQSYRRATNSNSIFSSFLNKAFFLTLVSAPFLIYAYYNKDSFLGKLLSSFSSKPVTDKSGTDKSGTDLSGKTSKSRDKNFSVTMLGPDISLAEYTKDCSTGAKNYKKIDNVEYIQLKTINQGDEDIVAVMKPKYESTIKDGVGDQDFSPGATCGSQALRNAYFLSRALSTKDVADKNAMLRAMSDNDNAKVNLGISIDKGEATSWLENTDIARRLSGMTLNDGSGNRLSKSVTVIDTVQMVESGAIDNIVEQFRINDNFYHVFIVSTGDIYSMTGFDDFMDNVKVKLGRDIDAQELKEFRDSNMGGHWYTIAIEKRGVNVKCMVTDTGGTPDLITDANVDERAKFLCEFILNGFASFNFKNKMVDTAAHLFEVRLEQKKKEQEAKLNTNKPAFNSHASVNNKVNNNGRSARGNGRRKRR